MFIQLEKKKRTELLMKLLSLDKIEKENKRYIHAIKLSELYGKPSEQFVEMLFQKFHLQFNQSTYNEAIRYLEKNKNPKFEARVYVSQDCFNFIDDIINDADLIFKNGSERKLHISELKYYLSRLTRKLVTDGGHSQIARNYYLNKKTKKTFKEHTNLALYPNKVAAMNKILNKYELIKVYSARQKKNLYVIGENNPYFYMEGINPKIVKFNNSEGSKNYWKANVTYADSKAEKLKKIVEQKDTEIKKLKEQIKSLESDLNKQKELVGSESSIIEDNEFLVKHNYELLQEIIELYEKLEKYEKTELINN
jgi:hypothetical protein